MNWIFSSVLGTFIGINIIAYIIFFLYRQNRERYMLFWALGWFISSLRYLVMLFIRMVPDTRILFFIGQSASLIGSVLFLYGVYSLINTRPLLWGKVIPFVAAVWILITAPTKIPFIQKILPVEILVGIIFLTGGILLLSSKKTKGIGNSILGVSLIIFGIIKSEFPLFVGNEALRPWNFVFLSITATFVSLGVLMVYIQKAKDDLSISEKKYRTLVENTNIIVCLLDAEETVTFINRFGLDFFGYGAEEFLCKKTFEIFCDETPENIFTRIKKYDSEAPSKNVISEHMENLQKDGTRVFVNWSFKPKFDEEENLVEILCVGIDETERDKSEKEKKKLQELLFQAQKMESMGRLAGGVAHDFNNVLASIMGLSEYLKLENVENKKSTVEIADTIIKESERAANLTRQLMGFARKGTFTPVPVSINRVITETISVSETIFKKQINLSLRFDEQVKTIEADEGQLQQVLTNLIINARDAMPDGGTLTITTDNFHADDVFVSAHREFHPGDYVRIRFCDTGAGIPEDIIGNIFEPFFTTKEQKGTGLGLSVVYGIVKNHQAQIHVSSTGNEGTCFTLYFPAAPERKVPAKQKGRVREHIIPKGRATILVIDDERFFRDIVKEMLVNLGHTVYTAESGETALALYKEKQGDIDIILTDIIMPGMNGKELFMELVRIDPQVKVIFTSGFTMDEEMTEIIKHSTYNFLQKPFRLEDLSEIIDKELKR